MGIDVVERGADVAVDEFAVVLDDVDRLPLLVREIEEVDGTSVEEIRSVATFPDPRLDALESAAVLTECDSVAGLQRTLPVHLGREFVADWVALLVGDRVVSATGDAADLAVAALPDHDAFLLVGRAGHVFRRRERAQLLMLARVAERTWTLLARESGPDAPG